MKDFIKVQIRESTSKTKGRNNSLYYPQCFKAIPEYIEEIKKEGYLETDLVLKNYSYASFRKFLQRLGKKAKVSKSIHPHLMRDSCATWLASKLNRQQLCIFFGWDFSSPMPDRYISRAGVDMKDIDVKISSENSLELKQEMEREKLNHKIEKENNQKEVEEQNKKIAEQGDSIKELRKYLVQALEDPSFTESTRKELNQERIKSGLKPIPRRT